ncbi:hypothetical protein BGU41_14145 [Clostridioides difficile]|nr:hypothetical protein BGU41_14145 [Clostridioides difficile]
MVNAFKLPVKLKDIRNATSTLQISRINSVKCLNLYFLKSLLKKLSFSKSILSRITRSPPLNSKSYAPKHSQQHLSFAVFFHFIFYIYQI